MDHKRNSFPAITLVICIIASTAFGFVGGTFANRIYTPEPAAVLNELPGEYTSLAAVQAPAGSIADTAAAVKQSVVEITTESISRNSWMRQYVKSGAGSGVIVSKDGYIVTNNHVITDAHTIVVRLANGKEYPATLKGADAENDLAILKIDATGLTPAVFGDSTKLVVGQTAIAVGNPLGELGGTVTCGIISALGRQINVGGVDMTLLQTDASVSPGNSGGGLFNLNGEIIGVVNAKTSGNEIEGIGFAIPINTVKTIMNDLIQYGYVKGRIDTGFTLVDVSTVQLAMYYRVSQIGLYVSKSVSNQFANGDLIVEVDGTTITNLSSFNAVLRNYRVGDTIQVTVVREGGKVTIPLKLSEYKQ